MPLRIRVAYNRFILCLAIALLARVNRMIADHFALWDDAQNEMERQAHGDPLRVGDIARDLNILKQRAYERSNDMFAEQGIGAKWVSDAEPLDTRGSIYAV